MFGKIGDEKYQDYAFDINNSWAHLSSLINDVLDVSKIEVGAFTLSDDIFDPPGPHERKHSNAEKKGLMMPEFKSPVKPQMSAQI